MGVIGVELLQTAGAPALLGIVAVAAIAILALLIAGMTTILRKPTQNTTQQPAKKTVDDIAVEVLAGLWGNSEDRKRRLIAAGYDPAEVQAVVNRLLKEREGK